MIKKIAIFDMDGVLVNSSWRYRVSKEDITKVDLQYWRAGEKGAYFDELLPMAKEYQNMLNDPEYFVIIATARTMNSASWAFIDNKLGKPNAIIYRKDNDNRGGAEMKIKGLNKILSLKQFKGIKDITVFEDNAKYLKAICDYFKCKGVYIPSNQGH